MQSDDLAPLITPHHSSDSGPTPALSSEEPAKYGQGTILTWNSETFENTVRFRGTTLVNLPVMAGTDALTFVPGDKVGIMHWAPSGGSGVFWILPRIIVPGSGAAEQAIAALKTNLGRSVALAVFGEAIRIDEHSQVLSITSTSFADPAIGDPGPTVEDVTISDTGRALVFVSADLSPTPDGTGDTSNLEMGIQVSGATSISAGSAVVRLGQGTVDGSTLSSPSGELAGVDMIDGLNPGVHTFTAKYRVSATSGTGTVSIPTMIVIPF